MAEANELWLGAGAVNTVFANHLILAFFDAIALGEPEGARSRVEEALADPATGNPTPNPIRAGDLAFLGMPNKANEFLSEWEGATPMGLRPAFVQQVHRANGMMAMAENRTEEGLQALREADRASFGAPFYEAELAAAYENAEMPDSALAAYHRFLEAPDISRRISDAIFLARAYEHLGKLHEARGEVEEAIKFHSLFVELWNEADPELQPRVEAARAALERLKGGPLNLLGSG
jgi:tetratricopeptide (TPR) repeat protein